jgi:hypothetical protein
MRALILAVSIVMVLTLGVWGENKPSGQAHAGLEAHRQEARNNPERTHHRRRHHRHHRRHQGA